MQEAARHAERRQAAAAPVDDLLEGAGLAEAAADEEAFTADLLTTDPADDAAADVVELSDDLDLARADDTTIAAPAARVLHVEVPMRGRTPIAAFPAANRWLVALVAAHAVLALFLRFDPERGQGWLERIPVVGAALSGRAVIGRQIALHNVRGSYQRLRNERLVFVISGEAINNSQAPVERLQVEGALYDATGEVDRKVISTGNEATIRLTELSESEIALLQRFEPRTRLAPGERVSFSIVFLEPPRDLREFSSRVLTARPTGRGSPPPLDRAANPASVG
jgi:hypothetical protein